MYKVTYHQHQLVGHGAGQQQIRGDEVVPALQATSRHVRRRIANRSAHCEAPLVSSIHCWHRTAATSVRRCYCYSLLAHAGTARFGPEAAQVESVDPIVAAPQARRVQVDRHIYLHTLDVEPKKQN